MGDSGRLPPARVGCGSRQDLIHPPPPPSGLSAAEGLLNTELRKGGREAARTAQLGQLGAAGNGQTTLAWR